MGFALQAKSVLAHARLHGLGKILLIDDDIRSLSIETIQRLESALEKVAIAGCITNGELDNSVVSHACRFLGYDQSVFLSGSCLAIDLAETRSLFPPIYNEDWLFMFEALRAGNVGIASEVEQITISHHDQAQEAVFQEPGEIIAEGLMAAFPDSVNEIYGHEYWRSYLESRRHLLASLIDGLSNPMGERTNEVRRALVKAFDVLNDTLPNDCVNYLQLLQSETQHWNSQIESLGSNESNILNMISVRPRLARPFSASRSTVNGGIFSYPEYATITIVCPNLPPYLQSSISQPGNPNHTRSLGLADLDAAMELLSYVQKHNPTSTVRVRSAAEVDSELSCEHLILLGGVAWNAMTAWFFELLKLPIQQHWDETFRPDGDVFFSTIDGFREEYVPHLVTTHNLHNGPDVVQRRVSGHDVAMFVRSRNPLAKNRTVTICNGVLSHGVLGGVRSFIDPKLGAVNSAYVTRFAEKGTYCVLTATPIVNDQVLPVDFSNSSNRLFEWCSDGDEEIIDLDAGFDLAPSQLPIDANAHVFRSLKG